MSELSELFDTAMDFAEEIKPVKEFYDKNPMAKIAVDTVARPIIEKILAGDFDAAKVLYDEANRAGSMKIARGLIRAEREDSSDFEQFFTQAVKITGMVLKGALVGMV